MKFFLFFIVAIHSISATVYEAKNWNEVQPYLEKLTVKDLAVFDVDQTLIAHVDPILLPQGKDYLIEQSSKFSKEQMLEFEGVVSLNFSAIRLMDPKFLEILQNLNKASIKTIALTAQRIGVRGLIDDMQEWRVQQLKSVGIDFSPFKGEISFSHLEAAFRDGILCSANTNKGIVLIAFLDAVNFKPEHVFFIDDRLDWVHDVANALNERGIANTCIHFRLIEAFDAPLNKEIVDKQLEILLKEKRWIPSHLLIDLY